MSGHKLHRGISLRVTGNQLLAHAIGDYIAQSDWMAQRKTSEWLPAVAHGVSYAACFLPLTRDPRRLAIIAGTHVLIDHYRIARHLVWAKNQLAPKAFRYPWPQARKTGYRDGSPDWLSVWLMIIADNCLHVAINALALNDRAPHEPGGAQ